MGFSAGAIVLTVGWAISAFQADATSQSSGTTKSPDTFQSKPIVMIGCLMRAEQASTPATGTTGALRVPPESYVLINAGAPVGGAQPADVTTFVLEEAGVDLASSVGKRVEVTATMPSVTGTTGDASRSPTETHEAGALTKEAPGPGGPAATPTAKIPRIRVASVRAIEGDCSSSITTRPN